MTKPRNKLKECTSEEYWHFFNKPSLKVKEAATLLLGLNPDYGIPKFDKANNYFIRVYEMLRNEANKDKELSTIGCRPFSASSEIETKSFFKWAFYKEKKHKKRFPEFASQLSKKIVNELPRETYTLSIPIEQEIFDFPMPETREQLEFEFLRLSEAVRELTIENNLLKPLAQRMQKQIDDGKSAGKKSGENRRNK